MYLLLNLKCDIKAIFKRKKNHPSSNYKFEIAAYKVDRYFSFNFVPMTIRKKFQKHIGSLQYFINNSYEDLILEKNSKIRNIYLQNGKIYIRK